MGLTVRCATCLLTLRLAAGSDGGSTPEGSGRVVFLGSGELNYDSFREKCLETESVCVVRKWAEQYADMQRTFSFDGIKLACATKRVETNRYRSKSRKHANLVDGKVVILGEFIERLQNGVQERDMVFDESLPSLCLPILRNYTVPFVAVNDYIHAGITGNCDWFSAGDCERILEKQLDSEIPFTDHPSLFLQAKETRCGFHVDAYHSHFLQVLHVGKKEWHVKYGADVETIVLEESDLIVVPAGRPHSVVNLAASLATSINFIDGSNWEGASAGSDLRSSMSPRLLQRLDAFHRRARSSQLKLQGSVSWEDWVAGVEAERFEIDAPQRAAQTEKAEL